MNLEIPRNSHRRLFLPLQMLGIILCCQCWIAPALAGAAMRPVRLAVLCDDKLRATPLPDYVQAAILASLPAGAVSFVERDEIARLMQEQQWSAALAPDKPGERAKLGRLLKADLLVILRSIGKETPGVEVAACETTRGLRLAVQPVALEKEPTATATGITKIILGAMTKSGEQVTEIVAVTPFVCHDLAFDFEHLKTVYAKLLEQSLLARPGVLVVELAEANAVAVEKTISGKALAPRPLPLYVYGEYHTQLVGTQRTVQVSMSLKRGDNRIAAIDTPALPLDQVAGVLQEALAGWMDHLLALEQAPATAPTILPAPPQRAVTSDAVTKQEAIQLAERAAVYQRMAYWEEASALYEASLLLDAKPVELHRQAAITSTEVYLLHKHQQETLDALRSNFAVYTRALDHLEVYLRSPDVSLLPFQMNSNFPFGIFNGGPGKWEFELRTGARPLSEAGSMAERTRDTVLRFIVIRARARHPEDLGRLFFWAAWTSKWTPSEVFDRMQKIIDEIQDFPNGDRCVYQLVFHGSGPKMAVSQEGQAFVKHLAESANPGVRKAGVQLAKELPRLIAFVERSRKRVRTEARPATLPAGPDEIVYTPIDLAILNADGTTRPVAGFQSWPNGCLPVNDGIDVFWNGGQLFVMKQKGILKRVWQSTERFATLRNICFDGKYVWVTPSSYSKIPNPDPLVLALDPVSEEIIKFTAADGLPPIGYRADGSIPNYNNDLPSLSVGPLDLGRACACGTNGRTWIAVLGITSIDGRIGKSVRVFHEAKEVINADDKEDWRNTHSAFIPGAFLPANDSKTGRKMLLLYRSGLYRTIAGHPLQIDCATLEVQPWVGEPFPDNTLSSGYVFDGHAIYYLGSHLIDRQPQVNLGLFRAELPDLKPECVCESVGEVTWHHLAFRCPDGRWLILNDPIGMHGAASERGPFHLLRGGLPDATTTRYENSSANLLPSHHYGVILYSNKQRLYQVTFLKPPEK